MSPNQRNTAIDTLKCIAALMVVILHYGYVTIDNSVGTLSFAVNALTRIAVPLFFMITGFYFVLSYRRGKVKGQLKKLCVLAVSAVLLYAAFIVGWFMIRGKMGELISSLSLSWHDDPMGELSKIIVFNDIPVAFHLWYLIAAIFALTAMWAFERWRVWGRGLIVFWLLVFVAGALLSAYSGWDRQFTRNFLTVGIPSMVVGRWIYEKHNNGELSHISTSTLFIILMLSAVMVIVQMMFHLDTHGNTAAALLDLPMGVLPLAAALLLLALRFPAMGNATSLPAIGAKLSGYIYIFHVIPGTVLRTWFRSDHYLTLILPFIVFFIALAMSAVWVRLKARYNLQRWP